MNTSIIAVINNDLNLSESTEAGKQVLASIIVKHFPLISMGNDFYKQLEMNRLKEAVVRHDILLGMLLKTDQSNFYTHHNIINSIVFSDIMLEKDVQKKIVEYVGKINLNDNRFNKVLKWLHEKQTWELNVINAYNPFVAIKDKEIYISVVDTDSVITDLFELNIPKGTFNTGPKKYSKLNEFGLEVLIKLFANDKVNIELEKANEEVEYIQDTSIIKVQPCFSTKNNTLVSKINDEYNADGKYKYLSELERKYIDFLNGLTHVVEVTHITIFSRANEVMDLVLATYDFSESENYTAKIVKVEDMKPNTNNIQYYVKEVFEFLKDTDFATDDIWKIFLDSI